MIACPNCGKENPEDARFCNACASPLRSSGRAARGAEGRQRALRRSRRLHVAGGAARPGGRSDDPLRLPRTRALRARALRRHRGEVHRRRRHGDVRRADRARGRPGARRPRRPRRPRRDRRAVRGRRFARAPRPSGHHDRRDARAPRRPSRGGRGDGRRRRRQHRCPPAVRGSHRRHPRRRDDLPGDRAIDRVPRRGAGRREGQGGARRGVRGAAGPGALRRRRQADRPHAARRPASASSRR